MSWALLLAALAGAAGIWFARRSRLDNFRSPARTWETLLAFWQAESLTAVRTCLTEESLALLDYVARDDLAEPAVPPELLDYLTRRNAERDDVYRKELLELLKLVRTNIDKFWIRARPRDPAAVAATEDRPSVAGLLRHILSGIPGGADRPAPRLRQVLETAVVNGHEYARVVYDPMFAGFGLVDTFKRTGPIWRLDLAAPLLEAAHATKTQFMPGQVVKVTGE